MKIMTAPAPSSLLSRLGAAIGLSQVSTPAAAASKAKTAAPVVAGPFLVEPTPGAKRGEDSNLPRPRYVPPAGPTDSRAVLARLLEDGGFEPTRVELEVLRDHLRDLAELHRQIDETNESAVRASYKRPATGPRPPVERAVEAATQRRRDLKAQRGPLNRAVAPVLTGILERALREAEGVVAVIEENEKDRHEAFAVPWQPSALVVESRRALGLLRDTLRTTRNAPDVCDASSVCRLLEVA